MVEASARKLVQKVDDASADALTGVERTLATTIKNAHETTEAGKEFATATIARVTEKSSAKA